MFAVYVIFEADVNSARDVSAQPHFFINRVVTDAAAAFFQRFEYALFVIANAGHNSNTRHHNTSHIYLDQLSNACRVSSTL
jgi:hypothetical protein